MADSFNFTFDTTTTDADPGAGKLRLNNASLSAATQAFVDLADSVGTDVTAWLDSLDDGSGSLKGRVRLFSAANPANYAVYNLSLVTTAVGYRKLSLAHVSSNGSLPTTSGGLALDYTLGGADGANGTLDAVSVRFGIGANIALTGNPGTQDGVTPANGDRVLVYGQTDPTQNGIYVVNTGGAWSRATDADSAVELGARPFVRINEGTALRGKLAQLATVGTIVVGTTALAFELTLNGPDVSATDGDFASVVTIGSKKDLNYGPIQLTDGAGSSFPLRRTKNLLFGPSTKLATDTDGNTRLTNGNVCNITDYPYNGRASSQSTTATGTGGAASLVLASAADFRKRDSVCLVGAGTNYSLPAPPAPTAAVTGTAGSVERRYRIVAWTDDLAHSPQSTELVVANCPDVLMAGLGVAPENFMRRVPIASTASIASLTDAGRYIDDVELESQATSNYVLLRHQADTSKNGFYKIETDGPTGINRLVRDPAAESSMGQFGTLWRVWNGTVNEGKYYRQTSPDVSVLDTSPQVFEEPKVRIRPYAFDVTVATIANITLSGSQTVDGVTLTNGVSTILVKNQTTTSQNGIYLYNSGGAWTRISTFDSAGEMALGTAVRVLKGTQWRSFWLLTTAPTSVGTDPVAFTARAITKWLVYGKTGAGGTYLYLGAMMANPRLPNSAQFFDVYFDDYGSANAYVYDSANPSRDAHIPATPPASGRAARHRARIASIAGTSVTLDANLITNVTSQNLYHDNSLPIEEAAAAEHHIYFPPGTYPIYANVVATRPIRWKGANRETTSLQFGDGFGFRQADGSAFFHMEDMTLATNHASMPAGNFYVSNDVEKFHGAGLLVENRGYCNRLKVSGWWGSGNVLVAGDPNGTNANEMVWEDVYASSNIGHGHAASGLESNSLLWKGCSAVGNHGCGIYDSGFLGNTMLGCHVSANNRAAYWTEDNTNASTWLGCYSEGGQGRSKPGTVTVERGGTQGAGFVNSQVGDIGTGKGHNSQTATFGYPKLTLDTGHGTDNDRVFGLTSAAGLNHQLNRLNVDSLRFLYESTFGGTSFELGGRDKKSSGMVNYPRGFMMETGVGDGNKRRVLLVTSTWPNGIYDIGDVLIDRQANAFIYRVTAPIGLTSTAWTASAAKTVGNVVRPTSPNTFVYVCTVAGTTHGSIQPTWPTTLNATVVDGTVTWECWGADGAVEGTNYTIVGGKTQVVATTLAIGAVAANGITSVAVTVTGARAALHIPYAHPQASLGTRHWSYSAEITANDTVTIVFHGDSTGGTPTAVNWTVGFRRA